MRIKNGTTRRNAVPGSSSSRNAPMTAPSEEQVPSTLPGGVDRLVPCGTRERR